MYRHRKQSLLNYFYYINTYINQKKKSVSRYIFKNSLLRTYDSHTFMLNYH